VYLIKAKDCFGRFWYSYFKLDFFLYLMYFFIYDEDFDFTMRNTS